MTQLLISGEPLLVQPKLAEALNSVDKAIILQQMEYWLEKSNHVHDGYKWIYNSYKDWHNQFPWLSEKTVQRYIKDLENKGLIISGNYNKAKFDRTKWYRIDYNAIGQIEQRMGLAYPTNGTTVPNGKELAYPTYTSKLPETTSETNNTHCRANARLGFSADVKTIIDYLNEKTHKHFGYDTEATRRKIKARFNEGFTLDDFKKVIDIKTAEWLHDPKRNQYLRPITLFSNKFESYLNQVPKQPNDYYDEYANIF